MTFTLLLRGEVWNNADPMTASVIHSTEIVIDEELAQAICDPASSDRVAMRIGRALLEGPLRRANRTLKKYGRGQR